MKSNGARSMPEIADTVPDSFRKRVSCTPQALKNCIIAIAPLTSETLCAKVTGAPGGANLVSGGQGGAPTFSTTDPPLFSAAGPVKTLPPNTRLSFREISCGVDAVGAVACLNARDQVGFVVSAAGSFVNDTNPLLDRPEGTPLLPGLPPVFPGMPG